MSESVSLVELAITFANTSPFLANPSSLALSHPALHSLQFLNPAGALTDAHVFVLPLANGGPGKDRVVQALKSQEGVLRVDVLESRMRAKRDRF
ncbi:hypothetical protein HYDPIDRAFT_113364 [Hydnomerulius pinastri MD-312]|uniref:Uncharacterized protein n=1 Tax=Hydnomerulius pinastri MD-312 TaxID=994086 RepID=A0A0C9VYF6_9AGAM|nr:hypothetical protein HYDPIDRAFT_113364 [Hydnomerulius pinastri MD-312]